MKKLVIALSFLFTAVGMSGQGFFKPVPENLFCFDKTGKPLVAIASSAWIPRPAVSIVAAKWWIDRETKKVGFAPFSAIALGIGWEHYVPTSDSDLTPYNDFGFNGLLFLGENICVGATFNYNLAGAATIHFGADYNIPMKRPELLTGIKFEF